jgi:hypothetical protein
MHYIVYQNDQNTVRVRRQFNDRKGRYYTLEHKYAGLKLFGITIIKDLWYSGYYHLPISTYHGDILESWIRHYGLKEVFING